MNTPDPRTPEEVNVDPVLAVQAFADSGSAPDDIADAFAKAFARITEFMASRGIQASGAPRAIYTVYTSDEVEFTVAVPVAPGAQGGDPDGRVVVGELAGGRAFRFVHRGPYSDLDATYDDITAWMKARGMLRTRVDWESHGPVWEEYVTDPASTPEEDLVTYIHVPAAR